MEQERERGSGRGKKKEAVEKKGEKERGMETGKNARRQVVM